MNYLDAMQLVGFDVQAIDGAAGKVQDADEDNLVIKPGVLHAEHEIPLHLVQSVDSAHHQIVVGCTRRDIWRAPRHVPFLYQKEKEMEMGSVRHRYRDRSRGL